VSRAADVGYATGWRLVRAMPAPVARVAFQTAADWAHRRSGPGTRQLAGNLRRVVGPDVPEAELDRLVRAGLRSYARYWLEAFRLPSRSRAQHREGYRLQRWELLAEAVTSGTGCVVAMPHAANWDAAGAWAVAHGWPLTTVAERLRPESLYRRFLAFREGLGMQILPTSGGARPPVDILADRLDAGHIVPLLADRDLSARGVPVEFFGGPTRMPPGPALLALRTGAPLYVMHSWYEPDVPCGYLDGPLPVPPPTAGALDVRVRLLTQQIADGLAEGIGRHPEDWHMLQRVWLDDRATATAPAGPGRG
jgi:phosphatidylinositol dimannoside acyltransferase